MSSLFTFKETSDYELILPYSLYKLGVGPFYYNCLMYDADAIRGSRDSDWVDISINADDVNDMPNAKWRESKNSLVRYKLIKRIFRLKFE
jgi:hypothetical protein